MDGRFMQGTFSANRPLNDPRPDASVSGLGGLSSMRTLGTSIPAAFCDGHVQNIPVTIKLDLWKALATWNGGEAVVLP
jgi:prepilin-type processing-associated H-X9-DG protein